MTATSLNAGYRSALSPCASLEVQTSHLLLLQSCLAPASEQERSKGPRSLSTTPSTSDEQVLPRTHATSHPAGVGLISSPDPAAGEGRTGPALTLPAADGDLPDRLCSSQRKQSST